MKRPEIGPMLLVLLLLTGCASRSVTLKPGPVLWEAEEETAPDAAAWSLWVRPVRDLRPDAAEGARVGLFYPRFQGEPQTVYVEPEPATYVREQLSRFLLHRGLEASEPRRAKLHLQVELTAFSLEETPGSVWDEIALKVAYTVRFLDRTGAELGHLKVAGGRVIQTPGGVPGQVAEGFRDSLGDTFPTILASDVYQKAIQQVR